MDAQTDINIIFTKIVTSYQYPRKRCIRRCAPIVYNGGIMKCQNHFKSDLNLRGVRRRWCLPSLFCILNKYTGDIGPLQKTYNALFIEVISGEFVQKRKNQFPFGRFFSPILHAKTINIYYYIYKFVNARRKYLHYLGVSIHN